MNMEAFGTTRGLYQTILFGIFTDASIFFFAHLTFAAAAILLRDVALTTRLVFGSLTDLTAAGFFFAHLAC